MNVSTVKDFMKEITTKEIAVKDIGKISGKDNINFKDLIKNKKSELNKNESENQNISKDLTEENKIIEELDTMVGKIEQSIEGDNEGEVIEDVVNILNLLNINIVNNESLPIVVEITEHQEEIVLSVESESKILDYNFLNNEQILNEKTLSDVDKLVNILKENSITNISEESVENINKLIDVVLPLVKDSYGDSIEKNDIIKALKNKLEVISSNDVDSTEADSLNITDFKINKLLDKNSYRMDINDNSNKYESNEFSTLISQDVPSEELSEEDKVLNKVLGLETSDKFLQGLNRLNSRNDIQVESNINSTAVFKDTMDEDVIKNVRFMIKNQIQELKVKIYPKELGEMTIKILSEEGIMRAEIKATSKETYNLLNSNINEIKKSLSNENIKIQEVNIELYNEDATYYSGQDSQEGFHNRGERFIDNNNGVYINDNEEVEEVVDDTNSNVDLLA